MRVSSRTTCAARANAASTAAPSPVSESTHTLEAAASQTIGAARGRRHRGGGDRRQRLVVDRHPLRGVAGGCRRLGDHDRHRLAHESRAVDRQQRVGRDEERRAVAAPEGDLVGIRRYRTVRDRLETIGDRVAAGEHRDHIRQLPSGGRIDAHDVRMGVG